MIVTTTHPTESTLVSLRQQDFHELQARLGHSGRLCLKKTERVERFEKDKEKRLNIT